MRDVTPALALQALARRAKAVLAGDSACAALAGILSAGVVLFGPEFSIEVRRTVALLHAGFAVLARLVRKVFGGGRRDLLGPVAEAGL